MFRRFIILALALALTSSSPIILSEVSAKSSFKLLPKTSLWAQIPENASKDEIKALCDEMIARQEASPQGMMDASSLYMHGMIMGVKCIKVDYYRALVLAHSSGDAFTFKASVTYIGGKARDGVTKAERALEKFDKENPGLLIKQRID